MTPRAVSQYTDQQILMFAKSYREDVLAENNNAILKGLFNLSGKDNEEFCSGLLKTFSHIRSIYKNIYEGILFVWPTGEVAFLAIPVKFFDDILLPFIPGQGGIHHLISSGEIVNQFHGLPDIIVVWLYKTKAKSNPYLKWSCWDGKSG